MGIVFSSYKLTDALLHILLRVSTLPPLWPRVCPQLAPHRCPGLQGVCMWLVWCVYVCVCCLCGVSVGVAHMCVVYLVYVRVVWLYVCVCPIIKVPRSRAPCLGATFSPLSTGSEHPPHPRDVAVGSTCALIFASQPLAQGFVLNGCSIR